MVGHAGLPAEDTASWDATFGLKICASQAWQHDSRAVSPHELLLACEVMAV